MRVLQISQRRFRGISNIVKEICSWEKISITNVHTIPSKVQTVHVNLDKA